MTSIFLATASFVATASSRGTSLRWGSNHNGWCSHGGTCLGCRTRGTSITLAFLTATDSLLQRQQRMALTLAFTSSRGTGRRGRSRGSTSGGGTSLNCLASTAMLVEQTSLGQIGEAHYRQNHSHQKRKTLHQILLVSRTKKPIYPVQMGEIQDYTLFEVTCKPVIYDFHSTFCPVEKILAPPVALSAVSTGAVLAQQEAPGVNACAATIPRTVFVTWILVSSTSKLSFE